jgi:hypothetical protein
MIEWRRRGFLLKLLSATGFTIRILISETVGDSKLPSKWHGQFALSGLLTLYHKTGSFPLNANADAVQRSY